MSLWNEKWSYLKGHVNWLEGDESYKNLNYARENFNDQSQLTLWQHLGFIPRTGKMYDMRHEMQPALTQKLIDFAEKENLENIGVSYYVMEPGDNLPYHQDLYSKYIEIFSLQNRKENIVRYIFFPEERQAGHIFEIDGKIIDWRAGDYVAWRYDTPHLAANLGYKRRYSIQVTGVLRENIK